MVERLHQISKVTAERKTRARDSFLFLRFGRELPISRLDAFLFHRQRSINLGIGEKGRKGYLKKFCNFILIIFLYKLF